MPSPGEVTNLDLLKPFFLVQMERQKGKNSGRYFWSPNMVPDEEGPRGCRIQENTYITSIMINSSFDQPVNCCEITLRNIPGHDPDVVPGDKIIVSLGYYLKRAPYGPEHARVFTGYVSDVRRELTLCCVTSISRIHSLLCLRYHSVINRDTVDKVIGRLAEEAGGMEIAEISKSEVQKSRYLFSDSETIYENMAQLCMEAGMDLYMDVHDRLVAKTWEPERVSPGDRGLERLYQETWKESNMQQYVHNFYFGLDIINFEMEERRKDISSLDIVSFSDYGEETECLYSIERSVVDQRIPDDEGDLKAEGREVRYLPFTPKKSAETIAHNLLKSLNPHPRGTLTVIGAPHVRLNDGLRLAGRFFNEFPMTGVVESGSRWDAVYGEEKPEEDRGSGKVFHVTGVTHIFDLEQGFISVLDIVKREPLAYRADPHEAETDRGDSISEEKEEEDQEDGMTGESEVAPEYPLVADLQANSLIRSKDEFVMKMNGLLDRSSGEEQRSSVVAEEYRDVSERQNVGIKETAGRFADKLDAIKNDSSPSDVYDEDENDGMTARKTLAGDGKGEISENEEGKL